jgi:hypothetical protein
MKKTPPQRGFSQPPGGRQRARRTRRVRSSSATRPSAAIERLTRDYLAQEEALLFAAVEREHPDRNHALYDRLVAARAHLAQSAAFRAPH